MSTVVFIAGMHRSGTSMVARLLNLCGVYLGPENELLLPQADNPEGFWENIRFVRLNEDILSELGGGWDYPPKVDVEWESLGNSLSIQTKAKDLVNSFSVYKVWGWKDPRNSLTFPFWDKLIPSMKVIVCVRNPLEVANSLALRNHFSAALGFSLWYEYNQRILLSSKPENRIITLFNSYFENPYKEIRKILNFLELDVSEAAIKEAVSSIDIKLRHTQYTISDLITNNAPLEVIMLHQTLHDKKRYNHNVAPTFGIESQFQFIKSTERNQSIENEAALLHMRLEIAKDMIAEKEANIQVLKEQIVAQKRELGDIYQNKSWNLIKLIKQICETIFKYIKQRQ